MTEPSEIHMKESKRILRYVRRTLNFCIHYYTSKMFNLVGFSDSYWGGSLDERKSTSGNCFSFGAKEGIRTNVYKDPRTTYREQCLHTLVILPYIH
jgi:hypothetical protein